MAQVPTGTTFFVATAFAAALAVSAVSNATEAVCSMASTTGLAVNDIVEVTSGWGRLNKRIYRVKAVVANTSITLEAADTSNTTFFPAGAGGGSVRKITTFTQFQNVMNPQSQGGDPKTVNYKFVDSDVEYSINDGFSATSYSMELDADTIGTAGYTALKGLSDVQSDTCLLLVTRNGGKIYQPCTCALNEAVLMQDGQINRVKVTFNGNNRLTRYGS